MSFFEVEQKYRLRSLSKARAALKKMSAKRIACGMETNEFYDRNGFFGKQRIALRLRQHGHGLGTLTLKGPRLKGRFTKRMEVETPIDVAAAKRFLKLLGCRRLRSYSKKRELYQVGEALISIDHLKKFGWFLEIEGSPNAIRKIAKTLGLGDRDREDRSYLHMLFQWKH